MSPPAQKTKKFPALTVRVYGLVMLVAVASGVGLGFLLSGRFADRDELAGLGDPVSAPPSQPAPTPTWADPAGRSDATPTDQIRWQLESWVLLSAGVPGQLTSSCDDPGYTGTVAATLHCTVTYEGLDVVYTVSARPSDDLQPTSPPPNGTVRSAGFEWTADAPQAVVTREGILRQFFEGYPVNLGWNSHRCEVLPERILAPVGKSLPATCFVKLHRYPTNRILIMPSDNGGISLGNDSSH